MIHRHIADKTSRLYWSPRGFRCIGRARTEFTSTVFACVPPSFPPHTSSGLEARTLGLCATAGRKHHSRPSLRHRGARSASPEVSDLSDCKNLAMVLRPFWMPVHFVRRFLSLSSFARLRRLFVGKHGMKTIGSWCACVCYFSCLLKTRRLFVPTMFKLCSPLGTT